MNLKKELHVLRAQSEPKQSKINLENIVFLNIFYVLEGNQVTFRTSLTVKMFSTIRCFFAALHDL